MGYTGDPLKGFGDYQRAEYGDAAQSATNSGSPNISRLNGYVQQAKHPYFGQEASEDDIDSSIADALDGLGGGYTLGNINDDAFAGYIGQVASEGSIESTIEDVVEDEEGFDGYGGLGEGPLQSWHSHFHQASLASGESALIKNLAAAVKSVPDDTPADVKRQYYNLALQMAHRRKKTDIRHLDLNRVEIESNLGWLINPTVAKTGGFQAALNKAVGAVGANLGREDKAFLKAKHLESLGRNLKSSLRKRGGFGNLGMGLGGDNLKYLGLGLAAVAAYYYFIKPKAAARKRRKKRAK